MATGDIIDVILEDHNRFRDLLSEMEQTPADQREQLFRHIVSELARHEAAEEALVHKATRDDVEGGRSVAEAVLEEESKAEQLLADLEKQDPASDEFLSRFRELRSEVLDHAEHEERDEHPRLRESLSDERLRSMADEFQELKDNGPTHPHPKTPQTPEVRAAAGPVAGVFDEARDKVREMISS